MNFEYLNNIISEINLITNNYLIFGQTIIDVYLNQIPKYINIVTTEEPIVFINYLNKKNIYYKKDIILSFNINEINYKIYFENDSYKNFLFKQITTMNSIAIDNSLNIIDYFKGLNDIDTKKIKLLDNNIIFEDKKIMIKIIRYASEYGFLLDESLKEIINEHSPNILLVDNHLIKNELLKILNSDNPQYIKLLEEYGLLKYILPELHLCFHTPQENPDHIYNVGEFIINILINSPNDIHIRLAALFCDIGKSFSKRIGTDGIAHFYGHEYISKEKASAIFERLYFSQKDVRIALKLIELHNYKLTSKLKSLRKFIVTYKITDEFFYKFIKLRKAIILSKNPDIINEQLILLEKIEKNYEYLKQNNITINDLDITTKELLDNGIEKKKLKIIIEILIEYVSSNPQNNNKNKLLKYAKDKQKKIRV
jgi:tRNA nucleotidyltransferase (CCA-adding enzyme)